MTMSNSVQPRASYCHSINKHYTTTTENMRQLYSASLKGNRQEAVCVCLEDEVSLLSVCCQAAQKTRRKSFNKYKINFQPVKQCTKKKM